MGIHQAAVQVARRLFGVDAGPKLLFSPWETSTTSEAYAGMNKYYAEYRRDSLVRGCINSLAFFSTTKGFQTALEMEGRTPEEIPPKIQEVKDYVDKINAAVNLDHALYVAVVKAKIFGKAGFEIVKDTKGEPSQLLPLQSPDLSPELDQDWKLKSFKYKGKTGEYAPGEIFYLTNGALEADMEGISDVEPVFDVLQTRRIILQEALKESARVLWAGIGIHEVDTSGLSDAEADSFITNFTTRIKPGKHIVNNQKVKSQVVDLKPNLEGLVKTKEDLDAEIIGNFQVPRYILGREKTLNRATAYAELEAFVEGPISGIQRWLKRELEAQWYPLLVRLKLNLGPEDPLPVVMKHKWNKITTRDLVELADIAAKLYMQGLGVMPQRAVIKKILGMDPDEILKEEEKEREDGSP